MDWNKEFERPEWWYQPDERTFENVDCDDESDEKSDDGKIHFRDLRAEIEVTEKLSKLMRKGQND